MDDLKIVAKLLAVAESQIRGLEVLIQEIRRIADGSLATHRLYIYFERGNNMGTIPTGSVPATETETATIVETETSPAGVTTTYPYVAANITWTIADNTIASFVTNADGSATFTGLKVGSTTGTVTDSATGAVQNYDLTVTAAPANTFAIAVAFGAPSLPTTAAGTASASTPAKTAAPANEGKVAVGPVVSPMYVVSQARK